MPSFPESCFRQLPTHLVLSHMTGFTQGRNSICRGRWQRPTLLPVLWGTSKNKKIGLLASVLVTTGITSQGAVAIRHIRPIWCCHHQLSPSLWLDPSYAISTRAASQEAFQVLIPGTNFTSKPNIPSRSRAMPSIASGFAFWTRLVVGIQCSP